MDNHRHTVDRLRDRFGTINRVAEAADKKQNTVSGWRKIGVPIDVAVIIAERAPAMGIEISYEEIVGWIAEDAKRRKAAA